MLMYITSADCWLLNLVPPLAGSLLVMVGMTGGDFHVVPACTVAVVCWAVFLAHMQANDTCSMSGCMVWLSAGFACSSTMVAALTSLVV